MAITLNAWLCNLLCNAQSDRHMELCIYLIITVTRKIAVPSPADRRDQAESGSAGSGQFGMAYRQRPESDLSNSAP